MTIAPPITLTPDIAFPPPVQDPPGTESPLFLVVVAHHADVERLPMLASLVTLSGGRLLVGIASPRLGFTTDAAVLWRAAMGTPRDVALLAEAVDRQLGGHLEGYEIVEMPYRDTSSAARRRRRIAAAADRLARRRRAHHLRDWFPEVALAERHAISH
jgi:hypothetical protein